MIHHQEKLDKIHQQHSLTEHETILQILSTSKSQNRWRDMERVMQVLEVKLDPEAERLFSLRQQTIMQLQTRLDQDSC